jgi:hypothetical protein
MSGLRFRGGVAAPNGGLIQEDDSQIPSPGLRDPLDAAADAAPSLSSRVSSAFAGESDRRLTGERKGVEPQRKPVEWQDPTKVRANVPFSPTTSVMAKAVAAGYDGTDWIVRYEAYMPLIVGIIAAATRYYRLYRPPGVVFDEVCVTHCECC